MPGNCRRYWELVEPLFASVSVEDLGSYEISIQNVPRSHLLLFAAHFCLSEVHNGGFLQFFWNSTGLLAPEAIEAFKAIGMPRLASVLAKAAAPLGSPYPRVREDRWDALLVASGRSVEELEEIFRAQSNLHLAFEEATVPLNFEELNRQAWQLAEAENGDFGNAATQYANDLNLFRS